MPPPSPTDSSALKPLNLSVEHVLEGSFRIHHGGFEGCEWGVIDGEDDLLYLYKTEAEARQVIAVYEGRNLLR